MDCFVLVCAATNELEPPSLSTSCACPEVSLNYSCTLGGGSNTVWSGTVFTGRCGGNEIALRHSLFETGIADVICGTLRAFSVSFTNTSGQLCYSSILTVPVSISLNGQTVRCSRDPSGATVSGSPHTLSVAGIALCLKILTYLPQLSEWYLCAGAAPNGLNVTGISRFMFTFSWTPTVNCSSVTSYQANGNVVNCGNCSHNPSTNTATCSGWTPNGQTCSVSVMSVICGGMTGEPSESVDIVLQGMYMLTCMDTN